MIEITSESDIKKLYPSEEEIGEFFEDHMGFENARTYFRDRGLLILTNRRSEVARVACRILFGYADYTMIKEVVSTPQDYSRVSGFYLTTDTNDEELHSAFRGITDLVDEKKRLRIKNVLAEPETGDIVVAYSYVKKSPGKMKLLDEEQIEGEFKVEQRPEQERRIVMFNHRKRDDFSAVKKIVEAVRIGENEESLRILDIELERFDISHRIIFIDRILSHDYEEWAVEEVEMLSLKKGELTDEEEPVADEMLVGINDALLRGSNLRVNPFVKRCERNGYYFTSVQMRMAHRRDPIVISLEIRFKRKPDMPELRIAKSSEVIDGGYVPYTLPETQRKDILDAFWHNLLQIFEGMISQPWSC